MKKEKGRRELSGKKKVMENWHPSDATISSKVLLWDAAGTKPLFSRGKRREREGLKAGRSTARRRFLSSGTKLWPV